MSKSKLISILDSLRKNNSCKKYEIEVKNEKEKNYYIGSISIKIDDVEIAKKEKKYNAEIHKFSTISNMLMEDLESSLLQAGIVALNSNKREVRSI